MTMPPASSHSSGFGTRALAPSPENTLHSQSSGYFPNRDNGRTDVDAHRTSARGGNSPSSRWSPLSPLPHSTNSLNQDLGGGMRQRRASISNQLSRGDSRYRWLNTTAATGTGDEPGVDVKSRRDEKTYGHLKGKTHIKVVDYSSNPDEEGMNLTSDFPGEKLSEWLNSKHGRRRLGEDGRPLGARWLHIDGVNWEVVKALTLHYGLHPLAIEDALEAAESPRSKLDFYKNHLYLQLLIHRTQASDADVMSTIAEELSESGMSEGAKMEFARKGGLFGSGRGKQMGTKLPEGVQGVFEPTMISPRRGGSPRIAEKQAHKLTVSELSAEYMVPIRRSILSVFMLRDGTLISMDAKPTHEVLAPIHARLEDEQSLLRRSGDVSMLTQAILDTVVDLATEVSQKFESEILNLEASVLVDPQMETVRHLHVLSSQLIRLKRALTPLLHVCYVVRDQDVQRSAAATAVGRNDFTRQNGSIAPLLPPRSLSPMPSEHFPRSSSGTATPVPRHEMDNQSVLSMLALNQSQSTPIGGLGGLGPAQAQAIAGLAFFSPLTKVYIEDVIDHLEIITGSLEQFVSTCDHLTDYVFNVLSFQTNASMERLSIVTVVFLPLTFIASYFGMNFTNFAQIEGPVSYFWKVAIPSTVAFFVIFSFGYLKTFLVTSMRRVGRWKRARDLLGKGGKKGGGRGGRQ